MDDAGYSGRLRKRKRACGDGSEESLKTLLELAESCGRMVIVSGSGLSANSGMSMFTTKNGLYERARSKFKIQDGMKLFSYPFYKQRRKDLQAFFAQIYSEAQSSRAAPGHVAIAELHKMGRLQRHYTLNIDGLAAAVGMDTWHHENNPEGSTVEMHGNISYVVCPSCHAVEPLTGKVMETMKACEAVICKACNEDEMRFKVMLYDDEQGDCITPEDVFERLDDDLAVAGAVVWVGISFEQSASTEYFRKVRHMLASHGRLHEVTQVILNPSDEPYFNVISTMSNKEDVKVLDVRATSDEALPHVVEHLHQLGGTSPDSAAMQAAAEAAKAAAAASLKRKLEQQQQVEQAAAMGAEEHTTPRSAAGRRRRNSGSVVVSPGEQPGVSAVLQADTAGSRSYAELAAMDSAAAAALSLPAAVQKHFAKKQLQLQLAGANGVKAEPADAAPQEQPVHSPPAAAADAQQQPGIAAVGAAPGGQLSTVAAGSGAQQQGGMQGNLQQLLGQLQAVHAVQAALASSSQQQQQQAQPPGLSQPLGVSPLLAAAAAAGLQVPALSALSSGGLTQLPGINPILAAVLASQQAAAAAAQLQPGPPAVNGNPLAAAVALLASSHAAAALMQSLANPALLAAATTSNRVGLSNGVAAAASVPRPPAAAAAPSETAGQPVSGEPADGSQADALQYVQHPAAAKFETSQDWVGNGHAAAAADAAHDADELAVGNGVREHQGAASIEASVKEQELGSPSAEVQDGDAGADA